MFARGTSFAAPMVSGAAALLLARDGMLTSGRVLDLLTGTARVFPPGSQCIVPSLCGAGMLDAGAAVGSTIPGGPAPAEAYQVVEYYRADLDHYFITADPGGDRRVDTSLSRHLQAHRPVFLRVPRRRRSRRPAAQPVCRFYATPRVQIDSHYYSANVDECLAVLLNWPGIWTLETASGVLHPGAGRQRPLPDNTLPVYRFFDNRRDANHRYTVDLSVRRAMQNRAWVAEGAARRRVLFADLGQLSGRAQGRLDANCELDGASPSSSTSAAPAPPTP